MVSEPSAYHTPVLLEETLRYLAPKPGEILLDATLGGGGHSAALAGALQPGGTLIGMDRDAEALSAAQMRLAPFHDYITIILFQAEFGKLNFALDAAEKTAGLRLDGALFDLGVSSHQLDMARGFSFRRDEPLNMRMDAAPGSGPTAAELLATQPEAEIARYLWEYGEERWARRIARDLVERRSRGKPIETTGELAALVEHAVPRSAWPRDIHVATRTFQALRIAVNAELDQLEAGLTAAIDRLRRGGRIVVISYHSLEDRLVKQIFNRKAGRVPSASGSSPAVFLPPTADAVPTLHLLTRKPVSPGDAEIAHNPRARSAKLRAAEKQ